MKQLVAKWPLFVLFVLIFQNGRSQLYAPAAGQTGSSAMHKDSSAFVAWVKDCSVIRGLQDVSTPSLGVATGGDPSMVAGKADIATVLSLGDGGSAVCVFQNPITNGSGFDFAVFENSFNDDFLELAFVEVSSDGIHYFRFPSHSLSDTINQCGSFGSTDAFKINNLAGKYRGGFGTPFDLQELSNIPELNINAITHIKIIDVVGSLEKAYAQKDHFGNKINDPWPTPFPSGGFDLDAIGVIHELKPNAIHDNIVENGIIVYPNPVKQSETVNLSGLKNLVSVRVYNMQGALVQQSESSILNTKDLEKGLYFLQIETTSNLLPVKLLIN